MPPFERSISNASAHNSSPYESDSEIRTAHSSCEGSLLAILDFLHNHGVAEASIQELQDGIYHSEQYMDVLMRAQEFGDIIADDGSEGFYYLVIGCWTSLTKYQQLQYKHAYKQYHDLRIQKETNRRRLSPTAAFTGEDAVQRALKLQIRRAEECCTCQRELLLAQRKEQQRRKHEQQQQ